MNRTTVKAKLQSNIISIVFEKNDGSLREMRATLVEDHLPELKGTSTKKENPDVQTVYDIEAKGWRSFRWDRLRSVEGIDYAEE